MPLVSPEIVHEVEVVEHVNPLGEAVTVYSVGAPPEPGATLMVAEPLLVTTEVMLGVPGATVPVVGVNPPDAAEATEVPELFVAVTVKEYAVPFVNPAMTQKVPLDEHVPPPGAAVAV